MNMCFVRIGSMNGKKQTHRNEKSAPSSRGIWLLPQKLGRDLIFLGYRNYQNEENMNKKSRIHKLNLSSKNMIWHHIFGEWEKCSVNEYAKILYKHLGKLRRKNINLINAGKISNQCLYSLDGEIYEIFLEN